MLNKHSVSKTVLTFHCLNESFYLVISKFLAFSFEFQFFFSITGTIFLTIGQNNFGDKIPVL